MRVGVLALQGDFQAHAAMLRAIGAEVSEVRVPSGLLDIDALVLPGGESTTMALGIEREGLAGPLRDFSASGRPVFGTCAGMIILGREHLGVLDADVRRNAFGRQVDSFETDIEVSGLGAPFPAVFIRAPWVESVGDDVEVLARVTTPGGADTIVAVRQGPLIASSFHPELTGDSRFHEMFVRIVRQYA